MCWYEAMIQKLGSASAMCVIASFMHSCPNDTLMAHCKGYLFCIRIQRLMMIRWGILGRLVDRQTLCLQCSLGLQFYVKGFLIFPHYPHSCHNVFLYKCTISLRKLKEKEGLRMHFWHCDGKTKRWWETFYIKIKIILSVAKLTVGVVHIKGFNSL